MTNTLKHLRKHRLGELEMRLIAYAHLREKTVVRIGELRAPLSLTAAQERQVFSRLARAGTILRLKREVYLLPPKLPLGGVWSVSQYLILKELMRASGNGQYQLCGWETFRSYGLTNQVSNRLYAYNNRLSGDRTIGGYAFTFIKVADERLGGVEKSATAEGIEIRMPSLARALVDAVYDWSRFDTLPEAFQWIREAVRRDPSVAAEIAELARRYGNQSTLRRIGYVLSQLGFSGKGRGRMARDLRSSKSLVRLVPGRAAKGPVDAAWGVIVNE